MIILKSYMIDIYVNMVKKGIKTIDNILPEYVEVVSERLIKIEESELLRNKNSEE